MRKETFTYEANVITNNLVILPRHFTLFEGKSTIGEKTVYIIIPNQIITFKGFIYLYKLHNKTNGHKNSKSPSFHILTTWLFTLFTFYLQNTSENE